MKKTIILFVILTGLFCSNIHAQYRDVWFVITPTYSAKIANVPLGVTGPDGTKLDVTRRFRIKDVVADIEDDKGFSIGDFRTGLNFMLLFPRTFIGVRAACNYSNTGFRMKYPGDEESTRHNARGISPELALRFTTGDIQKPVHFLVELGAAYTHNFSYKGSFANNKNVIGSGTTGFIGIGFDVNPGFEGSYTYGNTTITSSNENLYLSMTLEYRYDFYNFFNQSFTPDGITYPFKDFKTQRGGLYWNVTMGFKL